jgi:hypothetical protein
MPQGLPDRLLIPAAARPRGRAQGAHPMPDLVFIATGAAFLALCVLYAFACDRL